MTKHGKRGKGGRPRKSGPRYPNGKLKPQNVAPNARVMEERRRLLGPLADVSQADAPLDLALARGWLTERHHRAGTAFARAYQRAQLGTPGLDSPGVRETDTALHSGLGNKGMQDWTHRETTAVFDAVFNRTGTAEGLAEAANAQWRTFSALMSPEERAEVSDVCVRSSWPQWIIQRAAGHLGTSWERKRDILIAGLEKIATNLWPPRPAASTIESLPVQRARAPKAEVSVLYQTEDGEPVVPVSERGRAFDVVVRERRRPG